MNFAYVRETVHVMQCDACEQTWTVTDGQEELSAAEHNRVMHTGGA